MAKWRKIFFYPLQITISKISTTHTRIPWTQEDLASQVAHIAHLKNHWSKPKEITAVISTVTIHMHAFAHENLFRREKHKACVSFAVVYATQSCPTLSVTAWTVARQAPLSMGFPRQNTGVGCHFHLQGIFLTQGLSGHLPQVSYITGRFLTTEPPGKLYISIHISKTTTQWSH